MATKLYVGSLPYSTTDAELKDIFSAAGEVESAQVIMDRASGRSKGFGFVTMANDEGAQKALKELNGHDVGGRTLVVDEARPMTDRKSGFGGGRRF